MILPPSHALARRDMHIAMTTDPHNMLRRWELGAGYTTLGMALALPCDGIIHACDISLEFAAVGMTPSSISVRILWRIDLAFKTHHGDTTTWDNFGILDSCLVRDKPVKHASLCRLCCIKICT